MKFKIIFFITLIIGLNSQTTTATTSYFTPIEREIDVNKTTIIANSDEVRDIGQCYCDFFTQVCEFNCCCDADCTKEQIQFWETNSQCLGKSLSQKCVKDYWIVYINKKRGMKIIKDEVQKEICVQSDQQAVFDTFYTEKHIIPDETYLSHYKNVSFDSGNIIPQKGDTIKTELTPYKGFTLLKDSNKPFILWYPDSFGFCSQVKPLKFLYSIDKVQCTISYKLIEDCISGGKLDPNKYFEKDLQLYAGNSSSSGKIPITIIKYYRKDSSSSKYTALSSAQTLTLINDPYQNQCSCSNNINGIRYTFIYDEQNFRLTKIIAYVYLQKLLQDKCDNLLITSFFTEASFVNTQGTFFDGNIGYQLGQKVYAGRKKDANTIRYEMIGLPLNYGYDSNGYCTIGSSILIDAAELDPLLLEYLRFGQSTQISCISQWKSTDIQANCNEAYLQSLTLMNNFPYVNASVYFARTAFANRAYIKEWVYNKLLEIKENITYNATLQQCRIPTQLNLLLFYDKLGTLQTFQEKITLFVQRLFRLFKLSKYYCSSWKARSFCQFQFKYRMDQPVGR